MTGTAVRTEAHDIVLTRRFDAPRALVWRAWTDPQMMTAWWGPEAFTASAEMEVRTGGVCNLTMHHADGDYPIDGSFLDVRPEDLLVISFSAARHPPAWHDLIRNSYIEFGGLPETYVAGPILTRVEFADDGAGTLLTVRQTFPDAPLRDAHVHLGNGVGWGQSFDKLERLLAA